MKAGRLKYRLRLMRPVSVANRYGEQTTEWQAAATVWAERRKLSGQRMAEAAEAFADYRTEWNIRAAHHVEEGWRVEHQGGHVYVVAAIVPNADRDYLTLVCERLNE